VDYRQTQLNEKARPLVAPGLILLPFFRVLSVVFDILCGWRQSARHFHERDAVERQQGSGG
jgi:hypothetical protein